MLRSARDGDRGWDIALRWILIGSLSIRVALVLSGGQFYWPDESRYEQTRKIVEDVASARYDDAWARLDSADHPLFKIIGMIPAAVELASTWNPVVPALFFAGFSVVNIWLVGHLAGRLGAGRRESVLASAVMAISTSLVYWARHIVPYDVAMSFGLLAACVGVGSSSARSSLGCGVLAGCASLTYAGYWTLGAAAVVMPLVEARGRRRMAGHLPLATLGLVAAPGLVIGASAVAGGGMMAGYRSFSDGVNQGNFAEGWRLPFEYLWHAEHLLLAAWIAATVWAVWRVRAGAVSHRERAGLVGLLVVYGSIAIGSVVMEAFVVYGRLARQLVPFFCLLAAGELERLLASGRPRLRAAAFALTAGSVVQAGVNLVAPLRQVFPAEFMQTAGSGVTGGGRLIWVNATHIYPAPAAVALPPQHVVVKEAPHPLRFLPYQYEGYTPEERRVLRSTDIRMRLVVVPHGPLR
jgi:hypothetical protein